ncbi:MAG: SDR family NAD(P)-dependent oxidoreductase, partial [Actinomycetota bacterium]|nr:SDR family NAD(P)-dependent oxidoreductase [Actinomycetota bacterium]
MTRLCEGRVAIVTGAGRGIGREHALSLAFHGAKVVVNDLGAGVDGTGGDVSPAQQVVDEIVAMGGEAIANGDSVSSWEGAQRLINTAIETFGDLHVLVNNAGILRDRVLVNMTEQEWDAVINVHLKGTFAPSRWAAAYWREQSKAGKPVSGRII